ncbi:CBP80/20-dependent translation initiation factor isoform X1 [Gadus chalcogrammus]|uniref:CBP80/20-dependent translation initiation factor isoform X1 n=1 Tax=Gadus chalcogrammus TaxID=1042646 RepID=UPI0024C4B08D|nr:CBP80/20-dependent translation initiation factor isoform X1 [Gadus chalcogrammus]
MENSSSVASASSEAGSSRSQEIEELERFIDSYVLEYQVQGLLGDKADGETDGGVKASQWTEEYNDKRDGSWSSSRGRGSSKPDEWDHSSNGSTGSRPSCGSRPGSGSRSGSRGRNNQFTAPAKNGNREGSLDILGTDIWAANTMDSHGGAGWDVQPEKLDFTQFHRKLCRGTPKHLPHIDREGMIKDKFEEDDGIDMNDIERFLPHLHSAFPPLPNEAEIAHTKKLFRRRRSDRRVVDPLSRDQITILLPTGPGGQRQVSAARRQQRPQGPGKTGQSQNQNQAPPPPQQHSPQHQRDPSSQQQQQQQQLSPNQDHHHHHHHQDHHNHHHQDHHQQQDQSGDSRNNGNGRPLRQNQGGGHHGQRHGGPPHHGYSQTRRWQYNQKGPGHGQGSPTGDRGAPPRTTTPTSGSATTTKDNETPVVENVRSGDHSRTPRPEPKDHRGGGEAPHDPAPSGPRANQNSCRDRALSQESPSPQPAPPRPQSGGNGGGEGRSGCPKVTLLQSSKERLRRRLKDKDEACVVGKGAGSQRMDRLVELLNSMRSNSSGVEQRLTSFMEEAQGSARCEESLAQVVATLYGTATADRSFAATAAKLCDKMALFMVEGTKFRSLLLNMLQKDFARREELQQADVEGWLGFITFLCEVFGTMRSSAGEPFRVLVLPIYTCLRELLESTDVKEDAVICCSMELQSAGRLLEDQLPEMMTDLLAAARDKMLCPAESQLTRSLLMEVIELHAHQWNPLGPLTTQYYNRTIHKLTAAT